MDFAVNAWAHVCLNILGIFRAKVHWLIFLAWLSLPPPTLYAFEDDVNDTVLYFGMLFFANKKVSKYFFSKILVISNTSENFIFSATQQKLVNAMVHDIHTLWLY